MMKSSESSGTIDFHIHLGNLHYLQCPVMVQLKEEAPAFYERRKAEMTDEPRELENFLRSQGVERAVVIPELHPLNDFNVPTEMVAEYCRGSQVLIPFANINPHTEADPVKKLKSYLNAWNCRGLKLLPSYHHFYPNDRSLYALYQLAQDARLPVMFHIGSSRFPHTKLKYCDPLFIDEICADFPELCVIACHGGRGFWYQAMFFLLSLHKNLYIDLSGLPPKSLLGYFPGLEKKADRLLFGSDWPTIPSSIRENVSALRSLPIAEESKEKILHRNAEIILNL